MAAFSGRCNAQTASHWRRNSRCSSDIRLEAVLQQYYHQAMKLLIGETLHFTGWHASEMQLMIRLS